MTFGLFIVFIIIVILIFGISLTSGALIIAGWFLIPLAEDNWGKKVGSGTNT